jgi:hypothetical protein
LSYEGPVRHSAELDRIIKLPRRELDFTSKEVVNLAWSWSRQLLNDDGLREFDRIDALPQAEREAEFSRFARPKNHPQPGLNCPLLLSGEQAVMLYEAFHCKGVFASATVGAGKSLFFYLLALIFGAERSVLVVPASLEQDTHDKFADYSRYWKAPRPTPTVVSYEVISNPANPLLLCDCAKCAGAKDEPATPGGLRPTHLFADECDKLRNPDSAVTRRFGRYMSRHSDTIYCGATATPWRKSIKNSAPQIIWALKWGAPVPIGYVDMQEWSEALDMSTRGVRRDPGALTLLSGIDPKDVATYGERETLAIEGFQRRLLETPGIIQTQGQSCDTPLTIRFLKAPDDPILDSAFKQFRETSATLDGWDIDDPLSALRYGTEMSAGFFYYWNPRPPLEWLEARRDASKRVREIIADSVRRGRPLDTKAQVYRMFPDDPTLVKWKEVEPTFIPNTEARPISASVLGYSVEWIRANTPALIWVQHDYVGAALSAMSGVPFFGSKGKDASGRYIGKHSPKSSAILSLRANMRGRNLQAWSRNFVIAPPQAATEWEQGVFGRTHRQGQKNAVHTDVLISSAENLKAIISAHAEAEWVRSRGGAVSKLLVAEYDWSNYPAAQLDALTEDHPARHRWSRVER